MIESFAAERLAQVVLESRRDRMLAFSALPDAPQRSVRRSGRIVGLIRRRGRRSGRPSG